MNVSIQSDLESSIPIDILSMLSSNYKDTRYIPTTISTMDEFYLWCKRVCSIDDLLQYILPNDNLPIYKRSSIVSYLLSVVCKRSISITDRNRLIDIRSTYINHKKMILSKRRRDDSLIGTTIANNKRIRINTDDINHIQLPIDIIYAILSYMNFSDIYAIRNTCKSFYSIYMTIDSNIYIPFLSYDSILSTMKKLMIYDNSMDDILYISKRHNRILEYTIDNRQDLIGEQMKMIANRCIPILNKYRHRVYIGYKTLYVNDNRVYTDTLCHHMDISSNSISLSIDIISIDVNIIQDQIQYIIGVLNDIHILYIHGNNEYLEIFISYLSVHICHTISIVYIPIHIDINVMRSIFPNAEYRYTLYPDIEYVKLLQ